MGIFDYWILLLCFCLSLHTHTQIPHVEMNTEKKHKAGLGEERRGEWDAGGRYGGVGVLVSYKQPSLGGSRHDRINM